MQNWVSLIVCNFAVLAIAFLKFIGKRSNTTPNDSSGRRVGPVAPPQSVLDFSPARTGSDSTSEKEKERSGNVESSKLDLARDLELGDVSTINMTRTTSSPPITTMFDRQLVDSGSVV
jgi:hypothetical protein